MQIAHDSGTENTKKLLTTTLSPPPRRSPALSDPPKPFKFVYVSGEGATTSPGIFTAHFGLIKGRTEAALLTLSKDSSYANLRVFSLRPGGVDPYVPPRGSRMDTTEERVAETCGEWLAAGLERAGA